MTLKMKGRSRLVQKCWSLSRLVSGGVTNEGSLTPALPPSPCTAHSLLSSTNNPQQRQFIRAELEKVLVKLTSSEKFEIDELSNCNYKILFI